MNALKAGMLDGSQARRWRRADMYDRLIREIPLGPPVEPQELAKMILWLATDAVLVTGTVMSVDGGSHLRRQLFPDELSPQGFDSMGRRHPSEHMPDS